MRIFDMTKSTELDPAAIDLTLGRLEDGKLFVGRRPAEDAAPEVSHYETVAEYENGGKDVVKVVDVPAREAVAERDEYEDIMIYVPYSAKEIADRVICELKRKLADTDYMAIKLAEGELSADEYAPVKAERREWRRQINELEASVENN